MKDKSGSVTFFLFTLLVILPFGGGLVYALLYSLGVIGLLSKGFTFAPWVTVFTSPEVISSFLFTLYIGVVSLAIAVMLALYFLITGTRDSNRRSQYIIYLPLTIPALVAAFFTFQFFSKSGFLSRIFNALHITNGVAGFPDWVNDSFGIGIIVTHVMLAFPFFIVVFQNYYRSEKLETLRELSFTLGSSASQFNRKILIPVLLKKSFAPLVLYFIFILGSYEIPLLLGQQNPQMISVLVNRKLSRYNLSDIPQGYVLALIYTALISFALLFILKRKPRSNVAAG